MQFSTRYILRPGTLRVLVLGIGLVLAGCQGDSPVTTPRLAPPPVPTYTPTPAPLPADYGVAVPPVVYLAAHEIHHLLNACLQPNAYGEYFWRREWVPEEYPYTEEPMGRYDAGSDTLSLSWLEPQGFGGHIHPFSEARQALGDRLSPLWVGLYVNDPALVGPVQDVVCDERPVFHDAWAGHRNHSQGRSVRWLGHITVPAREPVVWLHLRAGSGVRVFLGGELLVDAIDKDSPWEWSGQQVLTPGVQILRLEYVERRGPVRVEVTWAYGSGERIRQGQTTRSVALRPGPGTDYPILAELASGTPLWLEGWAPEVSSQYWLGAAGVPAWWLTWWQGQPVWLEAAGVRVSRELDAEAFLADWEARAGPGRADSATNLCQRSIPARYLILKTLTRGWQDGLSCTQVTGAQLAVLPALAGVLDYGMHAPQPGDLAGLAGLADLQIRVGDKSLPAAFVPPGRYRRLRLLTTDPRILADGGWAWGVQVERLLVQSADWSSAEAWAIVAAFRQKGIQVGLYTPALLQGMGIRRLHLNMPAAASLPAQLLAGQQDMQELQVRFRVPDEAAIIRVAEPIFSRGVLSAEPLPGEWLTEVPNLQILHLDVPQRRLPVALFSSLTRLQVLRLRSDLEEALQLDWRALAHLEVLELLDTNITPTHLSTAAQITGEEPLREPLLLPAVWLGSLPDLRILHINSKRIRHVPPDLLARAPQLEVVELGGSNWQDLTKLCVAGHARLRQLHLNWSAPLVAHGDTAWRPDIYDDYTVKFFEEELQAQAQARWGPLPDEPCQTWGELGALQYLHRNRDFQPAVRDAPAVVWPSRSDRHWEWVTHRSEVKDVLRLRFARALPLSWLTDPALHPTILQLSDPALTALPDLFPGSVAQLRTLGLDLPKLTALPDDFLAQADKVHMLSLDLPKLTTLPDNFLSHLPMLEIAGGRKTPGNHYEWRYWMFPERRFAPSLTLFLHTPQLTALPEPLLHGAGVNLEYQGRYPGDEVRSSGAGSQATYLELALNGALSSSAVGLTQVAGLTHLSLELDQLTALPDSFLAQAPALTHLTLELGQLTALPDSFLAQAPALTHLTLELGQLTALPDSFLAQAPALTHLTLELGQLTALPDSFLAQAPALTHLTLELGQLTALPDSFLAQAPALTHLTLELGQLTALPDSFLAQAPALTHLTLELGQLTALPDSFLAQVPTLTHLALEMPRLTMLPNSFLTSHTQLKSLRLLHVHKLQHLPVRFLAHLPALQEVHLTDAWALTALPAGFLARSLRLREVILEVVLQQLPTGFLAHAPWLDLLVLQADMAAGFPGPEASLVCGNDYGCVTFPYSMPLWGLQRLCSWDEEKLRAPTGRCGHRDDIARAYATCPPSDVRRGCATEIHGISHGPWRMECHWYGGKLDCGP